MRRKPPVVGLKVNTPAKTIRQLRVFLRNCMRRKIIPPIDLEDFKQSEELTDAIYLTMGEIRAIKGLGKRVGLYQLIRFSYKRGNKDIVVNQPKCAWITSHTCRRSFCTNELLQGTPVELIMKISDHKSLKNFYRYIKISTEEAGRKISEIWIHRGELKAS